MLLLLVLCVCFHVACVMYLHLTSVQVGDGGRSPPYKHMDMMSLMMAPRVDVCRKHCCRNQFDLLGCDDDNDDDDFPAAQRHVFQSLVLSQQHKYLII